MPDGDVARIRRDVLAEAALELAEERDDPDPEAVLRIAVEAAERITGGAAALVLTREGRLDRYAGQGVDGRAYDTLARPDVLAVLLAGLRRFGGPLALHDVEPAVSRLLAALAPRGLVLVPVDADAFLVLIEPGSGAVLHADARAVVGVLARLTAAALARVQTSAALRASCEELRRLCTDVLVRQDGELGRTAHELHEGICQRLAAANAQLEALAALLEPQRTALARLRDARALVNQTLGELRELAQRLRPSVLENLGYVEALRWYLGRLRERAGVTLTFEVEGGEARLPVAVESALYRATEEALGPAARGSRQLRVRYRREPTAVRIEIAGSAPDAVDLVAIRERLRPFGGAVHVRSAPDCSAVIAVEVPAPVD